MGMTGATVDGLLRDVAVPRMFRAKQTFRADSIAPANIPATVGALLSEQRVSATVKPGMNIAIAVGSRGIRNIEVIVKTIVDFVKSRGAHPFIFPSMGSHGGATAEGQAATLAGYGITQDSMGCPIVSSMDLVEVGVSKQGNHVFMDRNAWNSDGVIVTCRVKPHTSFRGKIESGICKMLTVGMGKQKGASLVHGCGMDRMSATIEDMAEVVIESGKVLFALPCIENAYDETALMEAVLPGDILKREPELLRIAFDNMPRLIVERGNVLVVDEIGKNFGGTGADPNITGRFPTPFATGGARVDRIAFLNLSELSHGNAMGWGLADAVTEKLFNAADLDATYANCITSNVLASARMPCVMPSDKRAIQFCIRTCGETDPARVRVIRIPNTLRVEHIMLSEAYYEEVRSGAYEGLEALDAPSNLAWDACDNLL